jgi:hypothetical protein
MNRVDDLMGFIGLSGSFPTPRAFTEAAAKDPPSAAEARSAIGSFGDAVESPSIVLDAGRSRALSAKA